MRRCCCRSSRCWPGLALPAAFTLAVVLAGCTAGPDPTPRRSEASTPIGSTAGGQTYPSSEGAGPGGINLNYYTGADPNFPRGTSPGARHNGPGPIR